MYHKEENSVLFSLSHLQTLATASGLGGTSPNIPGDATKMLDIRRLSPALGSHNVAAVSPTLLMGPRQAVNVRNWIIPLCIGFGTLIICITILSLALVYNEPEGEQVRLASVATVDQPLTAEPAKPLPVPVVVQPLKKEALAPQVAPKTAEKPLRSVNDLIVKKRTSAPAKAHQRASKKKIRAYRKWKKRRAALRKRRRARRKRAKAAKRRRKKRTRLARAKLARRDRTTRSTKRRGPSKHSELDDLLTGL